MENGGYLMTPWTPVDWFYVYFYGLGFYLACLLWRMKS
jgi:hypothetical protein